MAINLAIIHDRTIFFPCVKDGITWETERKGTPGVLKFTVIKTEGLSFSEGDIVRIVVDGDPVFFGFVFKKKRTKEQHIEVTAYDQLRYFKNKETYIYKEKTASEVIRMMAEDFGMDVGELENTGYVIPQKVEDNKTLWDIAQSAMEETLVKTKKLYVLYDDFGKLTLKNIENMKTNIVINANTGENFSYESSIDDQTYNQIKLVYENEKTGKRDVYMQKDIGNISRWGVLQYYEVVKTDVGIIDKLEGLFSIYNKKTRKLKIENAFGVPGLRAGNSVIVMLNLGDITVHNMMVCEKVTHTFSNDHHTMDLTVIGNKEFIA